MRFREIKESSKEARTVASFENQRIIGDEVNEQSPFVDPLPEIIGDGISERVSFVDPLPEIIGDDINEQAPFVDLLP